MYLMLLGCESIGFHSLFTRNLAIPITLVGAVIITQWFFYNTIKILIDGIVCMSTVSMLAQVYS